jgi:hypothetical protein
MATNSSDPTAPRLRSPGAFSTTNPILADSTTDTAKGLGIIRRDLDAVKVAFGDAWQQSHLPEGYSALMTAYSVHHFFVTESSTRSTPAPADLE